MRIRTKTITSILTPNHLQICFNPILQYMYQTITSITIFNNSVHNHYYNYGHLLMYSLSASNDILLTV